MSSRGQAFIISGPAGSGKTTLIDRLHQEFPEMIKNISYTTRPIREGEADGVDYFFISEEQFEKKLEEDEFLEHVELFGFKYGTSKNWIEKKLQEGFSIFLVIDIEGAKKIKALMGVPSFFIRPPSLDVLKQRLLKRKTDPDQIQRRLARAQQEMDQGIYYDDVIVNDDLDQSYGQLKKAVLKFIRRIDG